MCGREIKLKQYKSFRISYTKDMAEDTFTDEEIEDFTYGDPRLGEYLQYSAGTHGWTPVENMTRQCMETFKTKFGGDSGMYLGQTLGMAVAEDATQEQALAGYILSFHLTAQLSRQMEAYVPRAAQVEVLGQCYEHVANKFPWAFYQIENYFNNHPSMEGGSGGNPPRVSQ
jgi:hypothetical protein